MLTIVIRAYTSIASDPFDRGHEFGVAHAAQIARTVAVYRHLFLISGGPAFDMSEMGGRGLKSIEAWAPDLAAEITGMAEGARLPVLDLAAVNSRTEILAALGGPPRSECSVVVLLGEDENAPPVAVQTWDWMREMAAGWLVWTIPHGDGRVTTTLTEYGVVGKIGVNNSGLGLLFTRLHHDDDGKDGIGVPVHVAARRALDDAASLTSAAYLLASAGVTASSSLSLVSYGASGKAAITAELHPGGPGWSVPEDNGMLVHTNHILDPRSAPGDPFPRQHPGTLIRRDVLRRGLREHTAAPDARTVRRVMARHAGGVCHHTAPGAGDEHITLATVELDLAERTVVAREGGPCGRRTW